MIIKVLLLTVVILGIAFAGFAISILIKKNGRFPELHIGANKDLKKRGIACATSQDKMEQLKVNKTIHLKQLTIIDKEFESL
ncbi:hypothetical protein [Ancylomarina longa]|uniref:Uncharacterized protein n=1 Tax=Ancylomarina longa TaxID=2487017 RepID=A0A434AFT9_9BACT|nr:hypothetical protein [Ancylomarina longa]RUT73239.1 hypothetical protein DLK05_14265 [Ancylomarina longa]